MLNKYHSKLPLPPAVPNIKDLSFAPDISELSSLVGQTEETELAGSDEHTEMAHELDDLVNTHQYYAEENSQPFFSPALRKTLTNTVSTPKAPQLQVTRK